MKKIVFCSIIALMLGSCNDVGSSQSEITQFRGKVKYETISASSKLAGRISEIYVEEGQSVKKGDTLALLDIPEVGAKMAQVEGAIAAARGQLKMAYNGATTDQLNQLDIQIAASKAQLNFAKESFDRLHIMYKDSLVSLQKLDEVKMKCELAQAKVNALESKKNEVSKSARTEQIEQAKGQLARAIGSKEEVLSANQEKYLLAPSDMTIETISLKEGELLTPGYALVNGYKSNSQYIRFSIPESKIYDFEVGKELLLQNPYTKKDFSAKIVTIKQLAKYAEITSVDPFYGLSESVYELKAIPMNVSDDIKLFLNATILIK